MINERLCIPPDGTHESEAGWMVAIGDSIEEAVQNLRDHIEVLGDCPLKAHPDYLYDAIKEIHSAEDQGIEFSEDKVPEPEIALS